MSSLNAIRAVTQSRAIGETQSSERQRDVLVLILSHLQSHGFIQTATTLIHESRSVSSLTRYECADNIDLLQILKEFEDYHEMKFLRRPVFSRSSAAVDGKRTTCDEIPQHDDIGSTPSKNTRSKRRARHSHAHDPQIQKHQRQRSRVKDPKEGLNHAALQQLLKDPLDCNYDNIESDKLPSIYSGAQRPKNGVAEDKFETDQMDLEAGISGFSLKSPKDKGKPSNLGSQSQGSPGNTKQLPQMWRPLPNFDGDKELQQQAQSIRRDIIQDSPGIAWNDIVGLDGEHGFLSCHNSNFLTLILNSNRPPLLPRQMQSDS